MAKDKVVEFRDTQADTFIEECFEHKCYKHKDYEHIINQWRTDKEIFSSITALTGFDFQHYSMHDKSHSIAILRNIEMVLGRDRVKALGASDLWLLLEAAYCHDIGMSVSYEELRGIWEEPDFEKFIKTNLRMEVSDNKEAAMFYQRLNELVHDEDAFVLASKEDDKYNASEFQGKFDEIVMKKSWPLVFERYIMLLYTEYIRKLHPERSRLYMLTYDEKEEKKIPHRMYEVVAGVALMHGKNFEDIFADVEKKENGFWTERMHPRFAAAMLRLGDLLDMDSNRFNIRMMKHMGLIPVESMLHLKKHKAITHLSYSEGVIEATSKSKEFDVCKTTSQWFAWLDEEVKNLVCSWNKIVPKNLRGCRLNRCKLEIYFQEEIFDASKRTQFIMDPNRVYEMLIGDNIYKSRLDFIREYIQNALDASKMQVWMELKKNGLAHDMLTPYDHLEQWFEQYKVEVKASIDWDKKEIKITFQDHGIGIEEECAKILSVVAGDTWRKREVYAEEIPNMPSWLRPTGGFGIGVQSAFMIADVVEIQTKTGQEQIGRKICLEGKRKGGRVSVYSDKEAENGTKIMICIRLTDFLNEVIRNDSFDFRDLKGNIYDLQDIHRLVQQIMVKYISELAKYSFLPIVVKCGSEEEVRVGNCCVQAEMDGTKIALGTNVNLNMNNEDYSIRYAIIEEQMYVWDYMNNLLVVYTYKNTQGKIHCYYQGMLVRGETCSIDSKYSMDIVYFGNKVSRYLTINRENFRQEHKEQFLKDVEKYKDLYVKLLLRNVWDFEKCAVTGSVVKDALIYYALGLEELDGKAYSRLLNLATEKIRICRVHADALDSFCLEKYAIPKIFADNQNEWLVKKMLLADLLREEYIAMEDLVQDLRRNDTLFFSASEDRKSCSYMDIEKLFALMGEKPDTSSAILDNEVCQKLAQENRYIIDDREVCDILEKYTQKRLQINVKENGQFIRGIIFADKTNRTKMAVSGGLDLALQEYIKDNVKYWFELTEFPVVVCSDYMAGVCEKYALWVKKVFPNSEIFALNQNKIVNKSLEITENTVYFILPFTKSIINSIRDEIIRSKKISKEKYDAIAKNEKESSLLVEWVYGYQANRKTLKLSEIWERYQLLLDWMYDNCFGKMLDVELQDKDFS